MKLVLFSVLALVLACGSYHAHAQFCTASGDPHIKTFDNAGVHFQGYGTFKMAEATNGFRVDGRFLRVGSVVTAVRSMTAQLVTQVNARVKVFTVISHGNWPGTARFTANAQGFPEQPAMAIALDPLYIKTPMVLRINNLAPSATECTTSTAGDGANIYVCNAANLVLKTVRIGLEADTGFTPRLAVVVTLTGLNSRLTIQELLSTGGNGPVRVENGRYYIGVQLPQADPYISKTNGLCGFFDGLLGDWEFINANNTNMVTDIRANRWYANTFTNNWGWSFAVNAGSSLASKHFGHLMQAEEHHIVNAMPNIDFESKLVFQSLDDLRNAEAVCVQQVNDEMFVPPCVFDIAALTTDTTATAAAGAVDANGFASVGSGPLNAYSVAFSNVMASEFTSSSSSSSGMSSATIATICLGAVALVGMLAMLVTFFKLRHVHSVIQIASSSSNSIEMNRTV